MTPATRRTRLLIWLVQRTCFLLGMGVVFVLEWQHGADDAPTQRGVVGFFAAKDDLAAKMIVDSAMQTPAYQAAAERQHSARLLRDMERRAEANPQ